MPQPSRAHVRSETPQRKRKVPGREHVAQPLISARRMLLDTRWLQRTPPLSSLPLCRVRVNCYHGPKLRKRVPDVTPSMSSAQRASTPTPSSQLRIVIRSRNCIALSRFCLFVGFSSPHGPVILLGFAREGMTPPHLCSPTSDPGIAFQWIIDAHNTSGGVFDVWKRDIKSGQVGFRGVCLNMRTSSVPSIGVLTYLDLARLATEGKPSPIMQLCITIDGAIE